MRAIVGWLEVEGKRRLGQAEVGGAGSFYYDGKDLTSGDQELLGVVAQAMARAGAGVKRR